jgi:Reverse transcriptase (RNA-dependent DNA polymerase)
VVEEIRRYPLRNRTQTPAWNLSAHATHTPDSPTISSALASTNKDKWLDAIDKKVSALEDAGTWTLVPHQPGMNIFRSHLILKAKRDTAGAIIKYKARLVAGGDAQVHDLDFDQSYAPVADFTVVRIILRIAARESHVVHRAWTSRTRSCVPHWQKSCICVHPRFWLIDSDPRS